MDWGMQNRLAQIIKPNGRCLFMPIDHGYFQGPTSKLEKPGRTLEPLLPYCDAVFVTRGVLRQAIDPKDTKPIILRVSGGASVVGRDLADEGITTSIEDALRLTGVRGCLCLGVSDRYGKGREGIEENVRFVRKAKASQANG